MKLRLIIFTLCTNFFLGNSSNSSIYCAEKDFFSEQRKKFISSNGKITDDANEFLMDAKNAYNGMADINNEISKIEYNLNNKPNIHYKPLLESLLEKLKEKKLNKKPNLFSQQQQIQQQPQWNQYNIQQQRIQHQQAQQQPLNFINFKSYNLDKKIAPFQINYYSSVQSTFNEKLENIKNFGSYNIHALFGDVDKKEAVTPDFFVVGFNAYMGIDKNFIAAPLFYFGPIQMPVKYQKQKFENVDEAYTSRFKQFLEDNVKRYGKVVFILRSGDEGQAGHYYSGFYDGTNISIINAGDLNDIGKWEYGEIAKNIANILGASSSSYFGSGLQTSQMTCGLSALAIALSQAYTGEVDGYKKLIAGIKDGDIKTAEDIVKVKNITKEEVFDPRNRSQYDNQIDILEKSIANFVLASLK